MLIVENLSAAVDKKIILRDVDLSVKPGELLVIMGPNGSGKTSLAYTIMGHPNYKVLKGRILLEGIDITDKSPDERAQLGLFLMFQNPVEIPGVNLLQLLTAVIN
jgi:Fe-S cluster assembly ATP-binding protein